MTEVTRETRELGVATTPLDTTCATATAASALEVAGLRERVDGVAMKLAEVDRRVGSLETAANGGRDATDAGGSTPASAAGVDTMKAAPGAALTEDSVLSGQTSAEVATRADPDRKAAAEAVDTRPTSPLPTPPSIVLMLSDRQFETWLGGAQATPALVDHELDGRERREYWRGQRNAAGRTLIRRR